MSERQKVTEETLYDMKGEKLLENYHWWLNHVELWSTWKNDEHPVIVEANQQVELIKAEIIKRCDVVLTL